MRYVDIKEHPISKSLSLDFSKDLFAKSNKVDFLEAFDISWKLGQGKYTAIALFANFLYHTTGKKLVILMHDAYALTMQRILVVDAGFTMSNISIVKGSRLKVESAIQEPLTKVFIMSSLRWSKIQAEVQALHPEIGYVISIPTNQHKLLITKLELPCN